MCQETTEVNIFEMHVIPDLEDKQKRETCTHIPAILNNMSNSLHYDLEQEMQSNDLHMSLKELTDLHHIIPEVEELMTLNPKIEML